MKKTLLLALAVVLTFSLASAQTTKIVIGPLVGNSAGAIEADTNETIDVAVWMRTAPGINIVGLHLPLSTKNAYVQSNSRDDGDFFFPLPLWDDVSFLDSNTDQQHSGYTNQSILGIKDLVGDPDSVNGIKTDGQWSQIAYFTMTTAGVGDGIPHSDAFIIGHQQENGGMVWIDFPADEMDNSTIETSFATLELPLTTGIDDEIDMPNVFSLKQNYPNPFNASTTISYSLPEGSNVNIDIFDIMGRKIETLVTGHQSAGEHSIVWNASNVSSGVYLYRITAGDYSETKMCNLLK